ncbi:MAG: flippase-like domain-containing protein [Propionibacteriaceae bacterium]|jgi:uncharacterized protein (TIRG00374 family)|nr:flippase-like domain-containing protein [Propionibacteriaceae bacterium]
MSADLSVKQSPSPIVVENQTVGVNDIPRGTVRNPADLVAAITCAVGIIVVCLVVVLAHNTTEGLTQDVAGAAVILRRIIGVPVTFLEMLVIAVPPIAVGIDLLVRRYPMVAFQGLIATIGGIILAVGLDVGVRTFAPAPLVTGLSVLPDAVTIPGSIAAITALLTAVASPARRRSVTWSWNLMWVYVVVAVVTSAVSLPGMAIALIVGRMAGYIVRYTIGVASRRAYGSSLIEGIQRAGFLPLSIDRVSTLPVSEIVAKAPGVQTPQYFSDHRLYLMKTVTGNLYNVIVLDGDRQVMSTLSRTWRYLRSRARGRGGLSFRQTAERTALLSYAVRSAGTMTPAVLAIAEADDSMLIVREATPSSRSFGDLRETEITDELLKVMWDQLLKSHRSGITHQALTADCFRITGDPILAGRGAGVGVWVLGWEAGELASSELGRRMDLTQMLALITTKVGVTRALDSAHKAIKPKELAELVPLLQIPAIPKATRDEMGNAKEVLNELRAALSQELPGVVTTPEQITRVGGRTILMAILIAVLVIVVLAGFNYEEVAAAIMAADWRLMLAAFGLGLVGFIGAAITFIAYSPVRLSFWKVCVCQVAAAFVSMAAPAGFGPAAINLRILQRKNVPTPKAAATVALTQATSVIVVLLALVVVTALTGSSQLASFEITPGLLIGVLAVAALVGTIMSIPKTRNWALERVTPILKQTWPRLVELFSSPLRLAVGVLGQIIGGLAYIGALQLSIMAFNVENVSFLGSAIVYMIGTSAASLLPTPGGIGTIEVTQTATLASMGVNAGVAASTILLFRTLTFWVRVPLGYVAYRWMRRIGEL